MKAAAHAVVALSNRLVDVGVEPLKASELWRVLDTIGEPEVLVGKSPKDLEGDFAIPEPLACRVAALLDSGFALAVKLKDLSDRGIWMLTPFDAGYPPGLREQLGSAAPPVLYGAGEPSLLRELGIGIVGSRDVGPDGAEVALAAARAAAHAGRAVISGGARGVDQLAMNAAFEAGGPVIGVLADSLSKAISASETRNAILDGCLCLCTPYSPAAGFSVGNAMGRNKLIYALSRVTLVVATASGKGGTWTGAIESLKKGFGSVAVWRGEGEGPGNAELELAGATPITEVADLLDLRPAPPSTQLSILDTGSE